MILLVGLGNPGTPYINNRHNVGFMFADFFVRNFSPENSTGFVFSKLVNADLATISTSQKLSVSKPQGFMNRSGESVKKIRDFYKIKTESIIVAHDDLDIPLGKFKIQQANGPKQHNGIASIEEQLGDNNFWRIRIGVENRDPYNRMPGEAYVLQNFTDEEKKVIEGTFPQIIERLQQQMSLT
ncbi:aminoacyl-tRNA hydrolase [Candidatus Roizmanbacteria bacterium]|nr:aminoacyl-tRNA hydrolase [Candidatus Roizmanbacteria bacterium]